MTTDARPEEHRRGFALSIRWKMLLGFSAIFTLVYAFIGVWVFQYVTTNAEARLSAVLASNASGGASAVDGRTFAELVTTVPPVPDPDGTAGLGYPGSGLYNSVARQLLDVRKVVTEAGVYSYFRDPADGKLYFAASAGYLLDPQTGVTYKVPAADVVPPETYAYMEAGLERTTSQPSYTDDFGSWISAYSPIRLPDGTVVGAIGLDYPMTYVESVQDGVRRQLWPVLVISYLVLLVFILLLSSSLARPIKRLDAATRRIAEGDYGVDVAGLVSSRFPDELYTLSQSFATMAEQVAAREASLTQEVKRLKVEIDSSRREAAVKEITESDFFADLTAKAAAMRGRRAQDAGSTDPGSTDPGGTDLT